MGEIVLCGFVMDGRETVSSCVTHKSVKHIMLLCDKQESAVAN